MTVSRSPKQIFVAGTWSSEKAARYAEAATRIGQELAEAGVDLATGPGTGLSGYVIKGYRSVAPRGKVRIYLPRQEEMLRVGETVEAEIDEVVQTDFDYPMRNVFHISQSDGLVVVTGGDGTLEECLPALIDYRIPTVVLKDSGTAAKALDYLAHNLYREWLELLLFTASPSAVVPGLLRLLDERQASQGSPPTETLRHPRQ